MTSASPQTSSTVQPQARRTSKSRLVAYWFVTLVVTFELVASFIWALVGTKYVDDTLTQLGYPLYLTRILGAWDLPGAVALLVPGLPRLKEWAYAGAFFKYSGAVTSQVLVDSGPDRFVAPLLFAILTVASWALRPPERRIPSAAAVPETSRIAWLVSILIILGFVTLSLLTIPA